MKKIKDLKNLKVRICKDNDQYFRFINREGIHVYSVEYTKDHKIRVCYKSTIKRKNKNRVDKFKEVCI